MALKETSGGGGGGNVRAHVNPRHFSVKTTPMRTVPRTCSAGRGRSTKGAPKGELGFHGQLGIVQRSVLWLANSNFSLPLSSFTTFSVVSN